MDEANRTEWRSRTVRWQKGGEPVRWAQTRCRIKETERPVAKGRGLMEFLCANRETIPG